jgi:hypothetical protein
MTRGKLVRGAFNQGVIPTIACFNKATTPVSQWGVGIDALIKAMQTYVDDHVAPVWGTPAKLVKSTDFVKNAWAIVFLDTADQPGALAYHDLTPDGLPVSKVFVKTTLDDNQSVAVSTTHELVEMLVDPAINMWTSGPKEGTFYAYESADPVEELSFKINGIDMSDFVYPAYFEVFRKPKSVKFDHLNKVTKPFQILHGGYQIISKNGKESQVFGSAATRKRIKKEDRRGHRSCTRSDGELKTADVKKLVQHELTSHAVIKRICGS